MLLSILSELTDAITTAIGNYGLYAVFFLMLIDAVFPAASRRDHRHAHVLGNLLVSVDARDLFDQVDFPRQIPPPTGRNEAQGGFGGRGDFRFMIYDFRLAADRRFLFLPFSYISFFHLPFFSPRISNCQLTTDN